MAALKPSLPFKHVLNPTRLVATATMIAVLLSGMMTLPALADAPAEGVVVEGQSVPGLALGASRAQVEAAYGAPVHCQDVEVGGDLAWCSYPAEGGSNVRVVMPRTHPMTLPIVSNGRRR
jgi:hypothetical protein